MKKQNKNSCIKDIETNNKNTRKKFSKKIYKFSNPKQAQKMAYRYLGKTARLYPGNKDGKKYKICDRNNGNWVNFGQLGYQDYTKHKNKTRRKNYLTRTSGILGDWENNKYSANNLSRNILW